MDARNCGRKGWRLILVAVASVLGIALSGGGVFAVSPANSVMAQTVPGCWNVVPSPNVGSGNSFLYGVAAVSGNDVWAVGYHSDIANQTSGPITMHWNGSNWSVVPSNYVGASDQLYAVAAVASDDVWAVGGLFDMLTLHWNGSSWNVVPNVSFPGYNNQLRAVAAISANDVWAVGGSSSANSNIARWLRWDGSQWSAFACPNACQSGQHNALGVVSPNEVWAFGQPSRVQHWDGQVVWSGGPSSGAINDIYTGATAISGSDLWVVGYRQPAGGAFQTLTWHINPAYLPQSAVVASPNPGTGHNMLHGVAGLAANDVWTVGRYDVQGGPHRTLALHWDGSNWGQVPSPNPGLSGQLQGAFFNGVAAVSANDLWAVGQYTNQTPNGNRWQTLVEHYTNPCPLPIRQPYDVTRGEGRIQVRGKRLVEGSQCNECRIELPLPFPYTLYDQRVDTATVGDNGTLGFGRNENPPDNSCLPAEGMDYAILPYWDRLRTDCEGCGIYTSVSEGERGRVFNIEWRAQTEDEPQLGLVFEARLYEGQNRFDIVYGRMENEGAGGTVGVQGRFGEEGQQTQYSCNEGGLREGLMLTFAQQEIQRRVTTGGQVGMPTTGASDARWVSWLLVSAWLAVGLGAAGLALRRRRA